MFRGTHSMWKERRHGPAEGMPRVRRGWEGGGGGATAAVSGLERTVAADQPPHLLAEGAHVLRVVAAPALVLRRRRRPLRGMREGDERER